MTEAQEAIEMGVRNALCWAVPIVLQEAVVTLEAMRRPSVLYRPDLNQDGDSWIALYGPDLQVGVVGTGNTPAAAMADFDRAWTERHVEGTDK